MKHYAKRDHMAQDAAGNYYSRHVSAMTAEALHAKSEIAGELAHRDMEIDRLRAELKKWSEFAEREFAHFPPTNLTTKRLQMKCPRCGSVMVEKQPTMIYASYPPQWDRVLWCGCGHQQDLNELLDLNQQWSEA